MTGSIEVEPKISASAPKKGKASGKSSKKLDIRKILVIGAGPIIIGQACEFDYSGTQGCKALMEEGYEVILINSNPATIMTDPQTAHKIYIEPITPYFVRKIIEKEMPCAILPTLGGQTALNCALKLHKDGTLKEFGIKMIGVNPDAIEMAEDRLKFARAMKEIGLDCPRNAIAHNIEEALRGLDEIGLPAIIRPSFTLGGSGGGIANTREEFVKIATSGLNASPTSQILIDQSVIGWKEYEMEVVRDKNDNVIIVCSIENIDPMGVHTGDSITVAPALTLTDKEYQQMRNASIAILRKIGVETGGSNVQFAVNPKNGEMLVIEMNPRVSRSSALASKATGFPIAKIAAKLAIGYSLNELQNDITKTTPASFEPAIDYIVVKVPRFAFEKFGIDSPTLSTAMRSVGEAMAIARNFKQALQKALRSMENGFTGIETLGILNLKNITPQEAANVRAKLISLLKSQTPNRILYITSAFELGMNEQEICAYTKFDPWFVQQIKELVDDMIDLRAKASTIAQGGETQDFAEILEQVLDQEYLMHLKENGFSDVKIEVEIAKTLNVSEDNLKSLSGLFVAEIRNKLEIAPVYKKIDTCAAEFSSDTSYMYSSYEKGSFKLGNIPANKKSSLTIEAVAPECESNVSSRNKVIILGSGPNRIGQGIEFDYACVHAAIASKELGVESIMINCNPETVSTDYDTSDRLYFEPITTEDVLEVIKIERQKGKLLGVVLQFGGQTPLKLSKVLQDQNVPLIGTSCSSIDAAEDRGTFAKLMEKCSQELHAHNVNIKQPPNLFFDAESGNLSVLIAKVSEIGYPVIIRPSYVIGGERMKIAYSSEDVVDYLRRSNILKLESVITESLYVDKFLSDAIEVDVDAIRDSFGNILICGIMEHIEEAGVHSGDSACSIPTVTLHEEVIKQLKTATAYIATELSVNGLINIQYAIKNNVIYVLEANPRASRTVPFVAKAINVPIVKIAMHVILGQNLMEALDKLKCSYSNFGDISFLKRQPKENACKMLSLQNPEYFAVKEAVLPFDKFENSDVILGPEMKSTGEVMGYAESFEVAYAKAQIASGNTLPTSGCVFISLKDSDKSFAFEIAKDFLSSGFEIVATSGTAHVLRQAGMTTVRDVKKVSEGDDNIVKLIEDGGIQLVINTTQDGESAKDSLSIRRTALAKRVPYTTTVAAAKACAKATLKLLHPNFVGFTVKPIS